MERKIRVIAPTVNPTTHIQAMVRTKRKVAGYARVSTDKDEQLTSYAAQLDYYTEYIRQNPDWEFVGLYADEGLSGLNTKKRDGFNRMIADALAGKIQLIVTKSVSRFARNTVDSLTTIRKLKEKGIECYFEKENIWTFDGKGELLLTIMSSIAQEESRSISENTTWGTRKRMQDGKIMLPYNNFLGYDKGPDDSHPLVINEEQAKIVKRIYKSLICGMSPYAIAKELTAGGVPTPAGKVHWSQATVESILTNEKYKGAALLQKKYTPDFLTKKLVKNNGEVPQYFIEQSHEAIIPPEEWELVQMEMERRKKCGGVIMGNSIFAGRIICGECGAFFGRKVWNSTRDKYRKIIWQCNGKYEKGKKGPLCPVRHITEDDLKAGFMEAYKSLSGSGIIQETKELFQKLLDTTKLDKGIQDAEDDLNAVAELIRECVKQFDEEKYNRLEAKYDKLVAKREKLVAEKSEQERKAKAVWLFLAEAEKQPAAFDEMLWVASIDKVVIEKDGGMRFCFNNGREVRA